MSSRLGPIAVECDAPPYTVVCASRQVGLRAPEDVRWWRLSRFLSTCTSWRLILNPRAWRLLLGRLGRGRAVCSCGRDLPNLQRFSFGSATGQPTCYLLGQCARCRTVFWESP
jgi:hypothetical protein